jgi:hypothetical protein
MGISAISGTMNYQALQIAGQKNNDQAILQTQTTRQASQEESKEKSAVQSKEVSQESEAIEAKSINIYA